MKYIKTALEEAGVKYSFERIDGMMPFSYLRLHIPSGETSKRTVYVWNFPDLLKLLNHWNGDKNWKYHWEWEPTKGGH